MKEIVDPQQVHSLNQDLQVAKEKDQTLVLAQSHDRANGGGQQQGSSSCLHRCWVQVRLHEKKEQQEQVIVVGKMRLEGAMVMVDEIVQVKVE